MSATPVLNFSKSIVVPLKLFKVVLGKKKTFISLTFCFSDKQQPKNFKEMAAYNYLTKEGHDRLKAELEELKTTGRQEAAKAIAEAREKGDLSENAEYDAAKDAQGLLELKINELEKALANARVLDVSDVDTSEVRLLTNVKIRNQRNKKEVSYRIVSESEANLKEKKISVSSPIGKGLLGKKVGEVAKITTPAGEVTFEILDISI